LPTNHETTTEAQVYLDYSDYYNTNKEKRWLGLVHICSAINTSSGSAGKEYLEPLTSCDSEEKKSNLCTKSVITNCMQPDKSNLFMVFEHERE
jgi:hypothetical protein